MKIRYQWATKHPEPWQEIDSADWPSLPTKDIPDTVGGYDDTPGHIRNVNVQGITTEGYDHVAIETITIGNDDGVKLTVWNDDPEDYQREEFHAIVWTILPLAPDPALGMAINTRQSAIWYCSGRLFSRLAANRPENTSVRPWSEFVPPYQSYVRHGVWLDDTKYAEHIAVAPHSEWGWMHWCEHLSASEIGLDGTRYKLKDQRRQGRYRQASHTLTYYQRDTASAQGWVVATNENAIDTTTGTSATQSITVNAASIKGWAFITPASNPNVVDWPSGTYNAQYNVTAASAGITYGEVFERMFNQISSDTNTKLAIPPAPSTPLTTSGTGLKLFASSTWDPAAGSAGDRYAIELGVTGTSHGDAITLTLNTTDSYADGPWGPAAVTPPKNSHFLLFFPPVSK